MDPLSAAAILDLLSKGGVIGATAIFLWLLLTDRVQTRGRVNEIKEAAAKDSADKGKLIARLDQRLYAIESSLARMGAPMARPVERALPELPPPPDDE